MISDAYAAGFFDGEGTVYCATNYNSGRPSPSVLVCISNTDIRPLEALRARWGGSLLSRKKSRNPAWRTQWQWVLSTRSAVKFLESLLPFLITKREVAVEAIALCNLFALPHRERMDYSNTVERRGRRWVSPVVRPEFREAVDRHWKRIRELNAVGVNATRRYDISASAYGPNPRSKGPAASAPHESTRPSHPPARSA
jgi:hypothetical protein